MQNISLLNLFQYMLHPAFKHAPQSRLLRSSRKFLSNPVLEKGQRVPQLTLVQIKGQQLLHQTLVQLINLIIEFLIFRVFWLIQYNGVFVDLVLPLPQ